MIRLFTTIYSEKNSQRRSEYQRCFEQNIACEFINEICVLSEGGGDILSVSEKIKIKHVEGRPTYQRYFEWISELAADDDVSLIANTDIFFDGQLALFESWTIPKDCALALARWDIGNMDEPILLNRNDSQDVWVFRGPVKPLEGEFQVGVPRCDNRVLYELKKAGYKVINPAFSIRTYHVHEGERQEYKNENLAHFVEPPYAYLWPHNLWSLPRTLWHNLRHPNARLLWQLDRRKLNNSFPMRVLRKIMAVLKPERSIPSQRN